MKTNIGISDEHMKAVALELNKLLADEYILHTKTRNYHWNVEGSNFIEMHKLYETQYEQLDNIIDDVAERVRTLGYYSAGRLKDFLSITHLEEPDYVTGQDEQLRNLLDDHETIIRNLRELITFFEEEHKDLGTADFVTGIMQQHEKMSWFLRSHLKTEALAKTKDGMRSLKIATT